MRGVRVVNHSVVVAGDVVVAAARAEHLVKPRDPALMLVPLYPVAS